MIQTTTDASTQTAPPAFQAWRKAHKGRWWIVATGPTESECLRKLLDAAKAGGPGHYDSVILPTGQEP